MATSACDSNSFGGSEAHPTSNKLINAAGIPNLKNVLIVNMVVPSDELRIRKNPSYGMAQRGFRWNPEHHWLF
jgi:hypothetical protein